MVSSRALQDLLGLSPNPSGGPDWEGTPLAGSMPELEAEEKGKRSHVEEPNLKSYFGGSLNLITFQTVKELGATSSKELVRVREMSVGPS